MDEHDDRQRGDKRNAPREGMARFRSGDRWVETGWIRTAHVRRPVPDMDVPSDFLSDAERKAGMKAQDRDPFAGWEEGGADDSDPGDTG